MKIDGVKRLIIKTHGSQAAFAREVGLTRQAISKMLRDDTLNQQVLDALYLERAPAEYRRKVKR
jgi:DNA-binding XRE family transcriptional regulator